MGKHRNELPTKVFTAQEDEAQDHQTLSNCEHDQTEVEAKEPTKMKNMLKAAEKGVEVKDKTKPKKPVLAAKPVHRYGFRSRVVRSIDQRCIGSGSVTCMW